MIRHPVIFILLGSVSGNRDHLGHRTDPGDYPDVILNQSYYIDSDNDVSFNEIHGSSDTNSDLQLNPLQLDLQLESVNSSAEEDVLYYHDSELDDGNLTQIQLDDYYDFNGTLGVEDHDSNETDIEVVVPVDQIISISPVGFEESPLNVTFEAVPGEVSLSDNTSVSVDQPEITVAVIQKVKDILTVANSNDTVQTVIDDLFNENVTIKVTTTEKPKSAVEIYLELLQSMIKPTHQQQVLPEDESVVDIGVFASDNEEGNIDYSEYDYYYEEFLSNQAVLNNFSEEDLLIGDSFETEGNINLMLETDEEKIVQEVHSSSTVKPREMFNSAFPELYRDLEIFDKISSRGMTDKTRNLRNKIVEKRIKKKAKLVEQPEENKDVSVDSTTTTEETASTERPNIQFFEPKKQRFVDEAADLDKDLVVMTSSGSLYGRKTSSSKGRGDVKEYFSVPYAEPPVGSLRFKSAQPVEPWSQILNSSVESPRCWSSHSTNSWNVEDTGMSEDCLYLSIWSPVVRSGELRAVIVWLTSGKEEGTLSGVEMAAVGEVVFVKVESRHGALGFFAAEDSLVTSNIGLLDQTLALKWIQGNIDLFGGDAARVTILGSGSGGDVASMHLLSSSSCNLYHNMILQSGNPFTTTVTLQEATKRAAELSQLVGCGHYEGVEMVDCLRQMDPQVLINQERSVSNYSLNMEPFPPTVDGQFLVEDPELLIDHNVFKKCPVMIGTNSNEGLAEMFEYLPELSIQSNLFELTSDQLDSAMSRMFKNFSPALVNLVKFQYGMFDGDEGNATKIRRFFGLQSALADKEVVCNVDKLAKTVASDNNKVYRYFFNPIGDDIFASELSYVLGEPLQGLGRNQGSRETGMSRRMIKLWSNFAKTDSPDQEDAEDKWPEFQFPDWEYLKLENEEFNIGNDMRSRVCQFWEKVVPKFLPAVPDKLSRRAGGLEELTCSNVKKAKIYFPGYRSIIRL